MAKKGVGWRPPGFRAMALERLRNCMHIGKLCEELGVSRSTLGKWRREQEAGREQARRRLRFLGRRWWRRTVV